MNTYKEIIKMDTPFPEQKAFIINNFYANTKSFNLDTFFSISIYVNNENNKTKFFNILDEKYYEKENLDYINRNNFKVPHLAELVINSVFFGHGLSGFSNTFTCPDKIANNIYSLLKLVYELMGYASFKQLPMSKNLLTVMTIPLSVIKNSLVSANFNAYIEYSPKIKSVTEEFLEIFPIGFSDFSNDFSHVGNLLLKNISNKGIGKGLSNLSSFFILNELMSLHLKGEIKGDFSLNHLNLEKSQRNNITLKQRKNHPKEKLELLSKLYNKYHNLELSFNDYTNNLANIVFNDFGSSEKEKSNRDFSLQDLIIFEKNENLSYLTLDDFKKLCETIVTNKNSYTLSFANFIDEMISPAINEVMKEFNEEKESPGQKENYGLLTNLTKKVKTVFEREKEHSHNKKELFKNIFLPESKNITFILNNSNEQQYKISMENTVKAALLLTESSFYSKQAISEKETKKHLKTILSDEKFFEKDNGDNLTVEEISEMGKYFGENNYTIPLNIVRNTIST